jgi:hypothetical protein
MVDGVPMAEVPFLEKTFQRWIDQQLTLLGGLVRLKLFLCDWFLKHDFE